MPFGVLDVIEALVTRSIDARGHRLQADATGPFAKKPWFKRKLAIAISFDTAGRRASCRPGNFDVNGDGFDDLLTAGDGDRVEVWLGGEAGISDELGGRQTLPANGRLRGGDWNGDGLEDLVLYDPRMPRPPVVIATNRGLLPGTLPHVGATGVEPKPTARSPVIACASWISIQSGGQIGDRAVELDSQSR